MTARKEDWRWEITKQERSGNGLYHGGALEAKPELLCEIITDEILPRLPVKSLMRFKCVCKAWSSLICSLPFVTAHRNFQSSNQKITKKFLFQYDSDGFFSTSQLRRGGRDATPVTKLPRISDLRSYRFYPRIQCINGLVCVSSEPGRDWDRVLDFIPVFVFNPATRESIKLPPAPPLSSKFRPTYEFGFSPVTNEYKVLQVGRDNGGSLELRIFTLRTDSSWRRLHVSLGDLPFDHSKCPFEVSSLYFQGAVHWIHEEENVILVFDVREEKFGRHIELPCPSIGFSIRNENFFRGRILTRTGLVEVGGCLAVHDHNLPADGFGPRVMVLWILKDHQNCVWDKEAIAICVHGWKVPSDFYLRPLCTIHTGELAMVLQPPCTSPGYDFGPPTLLLCNMETKLLWRIPFRFPDAVEYNGFCFPTDRELLYTYRYGLVATYEESIVPLKYPVR